MSSCTTLVLREVSVLVSFRAAVRALPAIAASAALLLAPSVAAAAGGDLDTSFNADGWATTWTPPFNARTSSVVRETASEKVFAAGTATPAADAAARQLFVAAYRESDGEPQFMTDAADSSDFGGAPTDAFDDSGPQLYLGTRLFVASTLTVNGAQKLFVGALQRSGSLDWDATFSGDGRLQVSLGTLGDPQVDALSQGPDGSLWVAGTADGGAGDRDAFVVRVTPTGDADTAFSGDGLVAVDLGHGAGAHDDTALGIDAAADGAVLGLASQPTVGSHGIALVRLLNSGAADPAFNGGEQGFTFVGDMYAMQSAGSDYVFVGDVGTVSSAAPGAVKVHRTGGLDATFGTNGVVTFPGLAADVILSSVTSGSAGRLFLGGRNFAANTPVAVALSAAGAPDAGFGAAGIARPAGPPGFAGGVGEVLVAVDAADRLYLATTANAAGGVSHQPALARLLAPASPSTGGTGTPGDTGGGGSTPPPATTPAPATPTPAPPAPVGPPPPAILPINGLVYDPVKIVTVPNVEPVRSGSSYKYTTVSVAQAAIDASGLRATYELVGVGKPQVPSQYRASITPSGVFDQTPVRGKKYRVTFTSASVKVLLRYYDPAKDPRDPVCDYSGGPRELLGMSRSSATAWLTKNRCRYVLNTIAVKRATDRTVIRAVAKTSSLPGGKLLAVDVSEPLVGDFALTFSEGKALSTSSSFDVRDWALSSSPTTPSVFTVQVKQMRTGQFVKNATVEVSSATSPTGIASGATRVLTDGLGQATFKLVLPSAGKLNLDVTVVGTNNRAMEGYTDIVVKNRGIDDVWTVNGRRLVKSGSGYKQFSTKSLVPGSKNGRAVTSSTPPSQYNAIDAATTKLIAPIIRLAQVKALTITFTFGFQMSLQEATRIAELLVPPVDSIRLTASSTGFAPGILINGGTLGPSSSTPGLTTTPVLTNVDGTYRQGQSAAVPVDGTPDLVMKADGVVAPGGGNVVAAGGANVVAAGGGNAQPGTGPLVIDAKNAQVVSAGGGNAVAAGGGNVIAAGGGNVIAAGGGNVIAAGGGNVIAAGGGNLMPVQGAALVSGFRG